MKYLTAYGAVFVILVALDFVWLGYIARDFYRNSLGALVLEQPRLIPAAIFYLLYPVGMMVFAVSGEITDGTWQRAAFFGGLFGFFSYLTYDFSNHATLKDFPLQLALVDVAWGTVVSATAAVCGYFSAKIVS